MPRPKGATSLNGSNRLLFHQDSPDFSDVKELSGIVTFLGWALSISGNVNVSIYVDGNFILNALYGLPRSDVQKHYSNFPNSYHSGYSVSLNTLQFKDGFHIVSMVYQSGDSVESVFADILFSNDHRRLSDDEAILLRNLTGEKDISNFVDKPLLHPSYFSLETTSACSSDCIMCPREQVLSRRKNTIMPEKLIYRIINEINWPCFINWEWINEPLCDPRIYSFMDYSKSKGIKNWITTTGQLLTEDNSVKLIESGVDLVVFSIDTLNSDLYYQIRRGISLETVLKNVGDFMNIVARRNSSVDVWITKIQLPLTIHEDLDVYRSYFQNIGINKIQFPAYRFRGGETDKLITNKKIPDNPNCYFIENEMAITTDGDVILCPCEAGAWDAPETNISSISIKEAWLTPKRFKLISTIRRFGLSSYSSCRENTNML